MTAAIFEKPTPPTEIGRCYLCREGSARRKVITKNWGPVVYKHLPPPDEIFMCEPCYAVWGTVPWPKEIA